MTAKDKRTAESILLSILFLIIGPTATEACPDGAYLSITQWWSEGARFRTGCRCSQYSLNHFWGDDLISNLFHNYCHWVSSYTIPLWNTLTADPWVGPVILALITLIAGAAMYDLLKTGLKTVFSEQPDQHRENTDGHTRS
jgi:hypothetical protein